MVKVIFLGTVIILLIHLTMSVRRKNLEPFIRFTGVKCHSSNKSVSFYKCFIKAYSQRNTTLNSITNLTRPVFDVKFSYDLTYKSLSNSYRSIINVTFEACSLLNGTANNPVFHWLMSNIPDLKDVVHACPYKVCWLQFLGINFKFCFR